MGIPIIAGVFKDERQASKAVKAVRSAGFGYEQVGVAKHRPGLLLDLKQALRDLGVTSDRASYYDGAFKSGQTVVSVRPDGRDEEASNILRSFGAEDFGPEANPGTVMSKAAPEEWGSRR